MTVLVIDSLQLGFSQMHKIGKIAIIANFVFPYICSFSDFVHNMMLVNIKLEVGDYW